MRLRLASTLLFAVASCGGAGDSSSLGALDPRCDALCASSDPACADRVASCQPLCQIRVAGMSSLCATCLLDQSNGGTCSSGNLCCPNPRFPTTPLDCATSCAGSRGVNPSGTHPICAKICTSTDASCSQQVTDCLQQCQARIQGVSGLCALCLLDGANGGTCSSASLCCPHPSFPTSAAACASVCG